MKKKQQIFLSVIIPAYNAEATLFASVGSVATLLPYGHMEVLIVENGSTDKTSEEAENLILAYGDYIRLLHSEKGVSNARNLGIQEAKGRWIYFLDADDAVDAKALRALLKAAEQCSPESLPQKHPDAPYDIVMGAMHRVYDKKTGKNYYRSYPVFWQDEGISAFEQELLKPQTGVGFIWGKLFRKDFLQKNHLALDPDLSMAEDAEFMVRAAHAAKKIAYYPYPSYRYTFNPDSAVRRYRPDYPQGYLDSLKKIRATILGNGWKREYGVNQEVSPELSPNLNSKLNSDLNPELNSEVNQEVSQESGAFRPYDIKTQETYYSFALYHLLLTTVNYSFNPKSGQSASEQIKAYKKLLEEPVYAEALKHIHPEDFSPSRRAVLMLIDKKLYAAVRAAVLVRHMQFKSRTSK